MPPVLSGLRFLSQEMWTRPAPLLLPHSVHSLPLLDMPFARSELFLGLIQV